MEEEGKRLSLRMNQSTKLGLELKNIRENMEERRE